MADRKISDLTALTTPAAGDYLPIIDISESLAANKNKRITIEELLRGAPDGTAGAPGIGFESDPNTGIYRPGTDQVAISTGGTGRLFVDASGNVGVGTATAVDSNGYGTAIDIRGSGTGNGAVIYLRNSDASVTGQVAVYGDGRMDLGTATAHPLKFFTNNSEKLRITSTGQLSHIGAGSTGSPAVSFNGSAPSNSFVITSAGLVGIGTSSIRGTSLLDARGDISFGSNANYYGLLSYNAGTGHFESTSSDGGFKWIRASGPTTSMTLDSSGRLGIGTTSPSNALHINSGATGTSAKFESTGSGSYLNITNSSGAWSLGATTTNFILENSGGTALTVDSSRRVGIGTTSPVATLHSRADNAGSGSTPLLIQNRSVSANTAAGISFAPNTSDTADRSAIIYGVNSSGGSGNATDLAFHTNANGSSPTERLRITSAGLVGVGTSSPQARLHITDVTGTAVELLRLETGWNNPSGNKSITWADGTNVLGRISVDYTAPTAAMRFGSLFNSGYQTSDLMTLTPTGLGIGTTSPSLGLLEVSSTNGVTLAIKNTSPTLIGTEFCQLTFNSTSNSSANFESAKIKAISTNGGLNLAHLTFENSGTERARIDSSGRLLVGISSSSGSGTLLETGSSSASSANLAIVKTNSGTANQDGQNLFFYNYGPSATARNDGTSIGSIRFYASQPSSGAAQEAAGIYCSADGTQSGVYVPSKLTFFTGGTSSTSAVERMRITNGGRLEAWGGSAVNSFNLVTQAAAGTTYYLIYGGHSSSGAGNYGTQSFGVWSNGNVINTNNSYGAISDIKLKENIVDANSQWDDLKALQVRKYNFKKGQTHTQIGLVAQEVELVSPGLVSESPDRDAEGNDLGTVTKSVNYSVLYMKAVKALQEAMERIETLEAKVAALEGA